jgi:DNA topoisomerase I
MFQTKTKIQFKKNSIVSAKEAGLVYISHQIPGISRKMSGKKSTFFDSKETKITDPKTIGRIQKLAIPPAYKNVWISPLENSHIQAIGYDARGRKQYRYHPNWKTYRAEINHQHMIEFGLLLPKIRRQVTKDLAEENMSKNKVLATVVHLLDITLIRVGNSEYAKENETYGLTTIRKNHVDLKPTTTIKFIFKGKSHKDHNISVHNKKLFSIVHNCMELPGFELFQYIGGDGNVYDVDSGDVNKYLKSISGAEISAKDFRTWWSTVLAQMTLEKFELEQKPSALKKHITQAVVYASSKLGNTPSVCRKSYIYPGLLDSYLEGKLSQVIQDYDDLNKLNGLSKHENRTLHFLQKHIFN